MSNTIIGFVDNVLSLLINSLNSVIDLFDRVTSFDISNLNPPDLNEIKSKIASSLGFARGGYTGAGNPNEVAGFVHKNEFVVNSGWVDKIGVENLRRLFSGFPEGSNENVTNNNTTNNTTNIYTTRPGNFSPVYMQ